jgi:hypothetical protein
MNQTDFAAALASLMRVSAAGLKKQMHQPAGRKPRESDVEISHWLTKLESTDLAMVNAIIDQAYFSACYSICSALDGHVRIDAANPPALLRLTAETSTETNVITESDQGDLAMHFKEAMEAK